MVQSIIKLIDKQHDRDTHDNAARLVIEILRVSRDGQYAQPSDRFPDPLLNTIESAETVDLLLKIIFGKSVDDCSTNEEEDNSSTVVPHSVIANGISILLALLETRTAVNCYNANAAAAAAANGNSNSEYGSEFNSQNNSSNELSSEDAAKQEVILNAMLDAILPWLPDLTELLVNPPALPPQKTTAGLLDPPLGQTRLSKSLESFRNYWTILYLKAIAKHFFNFFNLLHSQIRSVFLVLSWLA